MITKLLCIFAAAFALLAILFHFTAPQYTILAVIASIALFILATLTPHGNGYHVDAAIFIAAITFAVATPTHAQQRNLLFHHTVIFEVLCPSKDCLLSTLEQMDAWMNAHPKVTVISHEIVYGRIANPQVNGPILGKIVVKEPRVNGYRRIRWDGSEAPRISPDLCLERDPQGRCLK